MIRRPQPERKRPGDHATELTGKLHESTPVDWQVRESVRAKMRLLIKRLLRKYKYPPEGQEAAVVLVLEQAEALTDAWSGSASQLD
jgi:type I restriction enzyme R subunit